MSAIASLNNIYDHQGKLIFEIRNKTAVPVSMSIFSVLDFVGFLLRFENEIDDLSKEIKRSAENIKKCLLMKPFDEYMFTNKDLFIKIFRNGIAHTFFPSNYRLSFNDEDKQNDIFYCVSDEFVFNVARFYKDFMHFFVDLKIKLEEDLEWSIKFNLNLNIVLDFYNRIPNLLEFENDLKRYYYNTSTTTTSSKTTLSPNATGSLANNF